MSNDWSRRGLLKLAATVAAVPFRRIGLGLQSTMPATELADKVEAPSQGATPNPEPVTDTFPTQPPELAREMVTVSHFDLKRVQELVEAHPSLAKASWDWGFGDWEDAIGAASHMGNRPIAEYLLSKGARPSLFSAATLGQLDVVKAMIAAQPGSQRIRGPHSISLLMHAKFGGQQARPFFDYLQSLGDADAPPSPPLSDSDQSAVKGSYIFGRAANQRIDVTTDKGQATWTRAGMTGRPLFNVGARTFF